MTVFILPTKGATKYRGKYPTRARSIGGYASRGTGRHIELNDGTRLWSADDRTPEFSAGSLNDDYAAIKAAAIQMTEGQYQVLKTGAEIVRLCGHADRAQVERQARAIIETIKAPVAAATRLRLAPTVDGGKSLVPATVDPRARVAARLAETAPDAMSRIREALDSHASPYSRLAAIRAIVEEAN